MRERDQEVYLSPVSPLDPANDNRVGLTFLTTKPANDVDLFSVLPTRGRRSERGGRRKGGE